MKKMQNYFIVNNPEITVVLQTNIVILESMVYPYFLSVLFLTFSVCQLLN